MKLAMKICYDGTNYCGWQIQPNGISIQSVLEDCITKALNSNEKINILGSGRTDAGVHALSQVISCEVDDSITTPPEKMPILINRLLPDDISVLLCKRVGEEFHPQRSAKRKTYRYSFYISKERVPLLDKYALKVSEELDVAKMKMLAKVFIGEHDFKCMCASGSQVKSTIREIYSIEISKDNINNIEKINIDFCGNGFLYNMVRTLAGQFWAVGTNVKSVDEIKEAFLQGKRDKLAKTLCAKGLTLFDIVYENFVEL